MSWKGHEFEETDLSQREMGAAKVKLGDGYQEWLDTKLDILTDKYKVVAVDTVTGEDIIAEELDQKAINALPDEARAAAGTLAALSPDARRSVLAAFNEDGTINYPFKMAK